MASTNNDNQAQMPIRSDSLPEEQGSSTTAANQLPKACLTCCEEGALIDMPCGHSWCPGCISLACNLVRNERHLPIACGENCHVPEDLALQALPQEQSDSLKAKLREFKTRPRERCYCANRQCGVFILPELNVSDSLARCGKCSTITCRLCFSEQHEGPCAGPSEVDVQATDLMTKECYQRCSECTRMVERVDGCPHMTCYCGHEFCYHCASDIKVCNGCWHLEPQNAGQGGMPWLEQNIDFNTRVTQMQLALNSMHDRGRPTSSDNITVIINQRMREVGYAGPLVYLDGQSHVLWDEQYQGLEAEQIAMSNEIFWESFRLSSLSYDAENQLLELREQADRDSWDEDWSM